MLEENPKIFSRERDGEGGIKYRRLLCAKSYRVERVSGPFFSVRCSTRTRVDGTSQIFVAGLRNLTERNRVNYIVVARQFIFNYKC